MVDQDGVPYPADENGSVSKLLCAFELDLVPRR